jgi:hypothetical protein
MNLVQIRNAILETVYIGTVYEACCASWMSYSPKLPSQASSRRTCAGAWHELRQSFLNRLTRALVPLRSKMHGQSWNKQYGMQARSGPMLRGQLAQEVDDFMAVQKNEHGFDLLDSRAKRFMRSAGVQPDLWVLPEGVKIYLATARPEVRRSARDVCGRQTH